jgi:hypothetical protein
VVPRPGNNYWATSFIWGANHRTLDSQNTHTLIAETVVPFGGKNFFTGRWEWGQRDELFENDEEAGEQLERQTGKHAFPVTGYTMGYTRDVELFRNAQTGIGTNLTLYRIDSPLKPFYGDHSWGINVFLRVRLQSGQ